MAIRELILDQRRSDHSWSEQLKAHFRVIPTALLSARFRTGQKILAKNLGSALKSRNRLFIESLPHNLPSFRPVGLTAALARLFSDSLFGCHPTLTRSLLLTYVPGIRRLMVCDVPKAAYQALQTLSHISPADDSQVNSLSQRQLLIEKRLPDYQEKVSIWKRKPMSNMRHPFWWLRGFVISRIRRVSNNLQLSEALTQVLYHGGCLVKVAQAGLVKVKHLRFLLRICAHQVLGGDCAGLFLETAFAGVKVSSPRQFRGMGQPSSSIFITSLLPIGRPEQLRTWVSVGQDI